MEKNSNSSQETGGIKTQVCSKCGLTFPCLRCETDLSGSSKIVLEITCRNCGRPFTAGTTCICVETKKQSTSGQILRLVTVIGFMLFFCFIYLVFGAYVKKPELIDGIEECKSNIKAISTEVEIYANDNDGLYPPVEKVDLPVCSFARKEDKYIYIVSSDYKNYTICCGGEGVHYDHLYYCRFESAVTEGEKILKNIPKKGHYPQYSPSHGFIYQ